MAEEERIMTEVREGFKLVHGKLTVVDEKLDKLSEQAHFRQLGCEKRFAAIEKSEVIREAKNGEHDKQREAKVDIEAGLRDIDRATLKTKQDFRSKFYYGMLGAILIAIITFAGKYLFDHTHFIF